MPHNPEKELSSNPETIRQESLKDELKMKLEEIFAKLEDEIEQEREGSDGENSWLQCFSTQIAFIQNVFSPRNNVSKEVFFNITDEISQSKFGQKVIQDLVKNKYPDGNPPEEVKTKLIDELKEYIFQLHDKNF